MIKIALLFVVFSIQVFLTPNQAISANVAEENTEQDTQIPLLEETIESMEQFQWKRVRNLNGIQVFMKHRDESKIKSFLAKTIMEVPDPYSIAAVIEDFEAAPEWIHMMSEITEIERISDQRRNVRLETRLPWPVKDRDATINAIVSQDPHNFDITILMNQDDTLLPEYEGYVRIPEIKGIIRTYLLSGQRMAIELEFLMNPGGYLPPWVANVILKDISYYTLKKLRKQLLKDEYQNQKEKYKSWIKMPDSYFGDEYMHPSEEAILRGDIEV